tara:strand:+ start:504 stop:815 length:312 start_codon:yes stop_codon:yes gene_type:complete
MRLIISFPIPISVLLFGVSCQGLDSKSKPTEEMKIDNDGARFLQSEDCDDDTPLISPESTELCDGVDNNCDGQIDENVLETYRIPTHIALLHTKRHMEVIGLM